MDADRVLNDPLVRNWGQTTPQIIPPIAEIEPLDLYQTPKKQAEFEIAFQSIASVVSPSK